MLECRIAAAMEVCPLIVRVVRRAGAPELMEAQINREGLRVAQERTQEVVVEEVAEVEVGSSDYYKGFLETPIDEFDAERDPNGGLDQALKLGGGATVVLGALFLGFMASNGLL